ncbi:MAG: response regulator [Burkholderiaceae bacterium]
MSEAPSTPARTILVCDDDRLVLLSITSALRHAGFNVIEADNGDDAILLAREHRPELAILDIRMDGKTGLDVAAYLKDYLAQPFIFLSAFSGEEEVARGMSYGALAYLSKPVETTRLVYEVEKALTQIAKTGSVVNIETADSESTSTQQWVAVGMLMEREHRDLPGALRRLGEVANERKVSLQEAALEILAIAAQTRSSD